MLATRGLSSSIKERMKQQVKRAAAAGSVRNTLRGLDWAVSAERAASLLYVQRTQYISWDGLHTRQSPHYSSCLLRELLFYAFSASQRAYAHAPPLIGPVRLLSSVTCTAFLLHSIDPSFTASEFKYHSLQVKSHTRSKGSIFLLILKTISDKKSKILKSL